MLKKLLPVVVLGTFVSFGCADDEAPPQGTEPNLAELAGSDPQFSTLLAAVNKAGLAAPLADSSVQLTVFAPTNAAFEQLLADLGISNGLDGLTAEQLRPILLYHIMDTEVTAQSVTTSAQANESVDTLGGRVQLSTSGSTVRLDGDANVTATDLQASNGVIHVLDAVLVPSLADVVTTSPELTSLRAAVEQADAAGGTSPKLATTLDGSTSFTVLAPQNAAFAALGTPPSGQDLTDVLLYHALPGDPLLSADALALTSPVERETALSGKSVTLNAEGTPKQVTVADSTATKANVVVADIYTSNGVLHLIDKVLIPEP